MYQHLSIIVYSWKLLFIYVSENIFICFSFSIRVFFHGHWRFSEQYGKGGDHRLFRSTTPTCSRTFRHLFATLHVRRLSRIFNRFTCIYETATQWDEPPYRITIWLIDWLIDWWCNVWTESRFLLQRLWYSYVTMCLMEAHLYVAINIHALIKIYQCFTINMHNLVKIYLYFIDNTHTLMKAYPYFTLNMHILGKTYQYFAINMSSVV